MVHLVVLNFLFSVGRWAPTLPIALHQHPPPGDIWGPTFHWGCIFYTVLGTERVFNVVVYTRIVLDCLGATNTDDSKNGCCQPVFQVPCVYVFGITTVISQHTHTPRACTHTHTHSEYSTVSVIFPLTSLWSSLLSVLALGPTVILRVYSCLDLGPETGRLQHV